MRRGSKPQLISDENDKYIAVSLSSDFTAEHEWGIQDIKDAFGILSGPEAEEFYGIEKRKIRTVPENFRWIKYQKREGFILGYERWTPKDLLTKNSELNEYNSTLVAAWDEKTFAVVASEPERIESLRNIYNEFASHNIIIMLGGRKSFENPGLVIAIADKIPEDEAQNMIRADKESQSVKKEFEETGIEKLLAEKKKRYFALRPDRSADGKLKFWLNPMEQDKNNFGWFTLEDLTQWAEGKGRIPKTVKE